MNKYAEQIEAGNCATLWVCVCCMLAHANGECCADDHDKEPLSTIPETADISLGLLAEEHADDCSPWKRSEDGCDCETRTFSYSSCDGCGSALGGERHALFIVYDMRQH
jgi:hypothetical protein